MINQRSSCSPKGVHTVTLADPNIFIIMTSGKQAREVYTPLNPTLIYSKTWGMQGYTYFSCFCSKTYISEGRDVFPCDFRAKIDFFALNDCLCVIIMENDGVQFF